MDAIFCDGLAARMDRAIELVLSGAVEFYTVHESVQTRVTVAKSLQGRLYLKTKPNTWLSDNLGEICRASKRAPPSFGAFGRGPNIGANGLSVAKLPRGFAGVAGILDPKRR